MLMFGRATIFAQISISSILTETKSYTFFKNEHKSVVGAQQTPQNKIANFGSLAHFITLFYFTGVEKGYTEHSNE